MHEEIITFAPDQSRPFNIQMAGVSYCDGSYRINRTDSEIHCIEYIVSGTGTVREDDRQFTASAGDVYILHRGREHCYFSDADDPWIKIWMNVYGPLSDSLIELHGLGRVNHIRNVDTISALFSEFVKNAEKMQKRNESFSSPELIFHSIVLNLSETLRARAEETDVSLAVQIKREIDASADCLITLDELAARLFCSKSYMIKAFRDAYGTSPYEYLLRRRIWLAQMLLANSSQSVGQIADRLGFCDSHYFSGFFRSRTGMSPMQFRKSSRK